jgi:hypothetical protein
MKGGKKALKFLGGISRFGYACYENIQKTPKKRRIYEKNYNCIVTARFTCGSTWWLLPQKSSRSSAAPAPGSSSRTGSGT